MSLTPEQIAQDFCAANPGKSVVIPRTLVLDAAGNTTYPTTRKETQVPITVYGVDSKLNFGKYKGTGITINQAMTKDPDYLLWCHHKIDWFALEPQLYRDACVLANIPISESYAKKAAQATKPEQPRAAPNADMFDAEEEDGYDEDKPF